MTEPDAAAVGDRTLRAFQHTLERVAATICAYADRVVCVTANIWQMLVSVARWMLDAVKTFLVETIRLWMAIEHNVSRVCALLVVFVYSVRKMLALLLITAVLGVGALYWWVPRIFFCVAVFVLVVSGVAEARDGTSATTEIGRLSEEALQFYTKWIRRGLNVVLMLVSSYAILSWREPQLLANAWAAVTAAATSDTTASGSDTTTSPTTSRSTTETAATIAAVASANTVASAGTPSPSDTTGAPGGLVALASARFLNGCPATPIWIAVRYLRADGHVLTRGWILVAPGGNAEIDDAVPGSLLYARARSDDGRFEWPGDAPPGTPADTFAVAMSRPFRVLDDSTIRGDDVAWVPFTEARLSAAETPIEFGCGK